MKHKCRSRDKEPPIRRRPNHAALLTALAILLGPAVLVGWALGHLVAWLSR